MQVGLTGKTISPPIYIAIGVSGAVHHIAGMEKSGIIAVVPGPLRRLTNRFLEPYPVISERCVGCGKCAESCPQHIIKIENKRAHIDYKSCQKCYCCQEMCIPKAIDLRRKLKVPKS